MDGKVNQTDIHFSVASLSEMSDTAAMRHKAFLRKAARHQLVHELRAAGASYKEISEKVGVKSVTIWKYLKTYDPVVPPRRALSLERQEEARKMKQAGATYQAIGERFGMTAQSACELLRDAAPVQMHGTCEVCGEDADLVQHHTDYVLNTVIAVCRSCHMKEFHAETTAKATLTSAIDRTKPPKPKIGRMGPAPRLVDGKTAKEMAAIWGVGLHQAQVRFAKILGPRWIRSDKQSP